MRLLTIKLHRNDNELKYVFRNSYIDTIEKLSALYTKVNLEHTVNYNNNTIEVTHEFDNDIDIKILLSIPQCFDNRVYISDSELEEYERKLRVII